MGKSNTTDGVQPPVGEGKQSRNSVLGFSSRNDDIYVKHDDDINIRPDGHIIYNVHNIFIDHIDHSSESKYHHHHSPEGGLIHHKHYHGVNINDDGHGHKLNRYYSNNLVGNEHYGSNNHDHSDNSSTEHRST